MKKLTIIVIVSLCLIVTVPVLAAVVWHWNAGDSCDGFYAPEGEVSCDSNGILMSATLGYVYYDSEVEAYSCDVTTNCTAFYIYDDDEIEYEYTGLPINMTILPGGRIQFYSNYPDEDCYISSISFDDQPISDNPPGPILPDFSVSGIFTMAGQVVNAMGGIIALTAGLGLGFAVVGKVDNLFRKVL